MDPFQVRAEVRTSLAAAAVEENSGLAGEFRDCREAAARNLRTGRRREAGRSPEAAARSQEVAARNREAPARREMAHGQHLRPRGPR